MRIDLLFICQVNVVMIKVRYSPKPLVHRSTDPVKILRLNITKVNQI